MSGRVFPDFDIQARLDEPTGKVVVQVTTYIDPELIYDSPSIRHLLERNNFMGRVMNGR